MKRTSTILGASMTFVALSFHAEARADSRMDSRIDSRIRGVASNVIAAGATHALLDVNGGRGGAVWGADGVSTKTSPVSLPGYAKVAAGTSFSLAVDRTGHLLGWGKNNAHQAGTGSADPVTTPTPIGSGATWKWVAAGATHGLAITGGGALFAWGQNSDGELGQGNTSASLATPTAVVSSARWLEAAGGNQFSVAIQANGSLWSWGHNASGQLGDGTTSARHAPVPVSSALPWVAVAAGDSHTLGIKGDGSLWTWGLNDQGQLGCGTCTSPQKAPVQLTTPAGQWVAVSAGLKSSYALRSDGTLWAWGYNNHGQLGNNSTTLQKSPVQVGGGYQFIAAGGDFAVAVTADGSLWTWGNNGSGQLGNGTTTQLLIPTRVPDTANGIYRAVKPAVLVGSSLGLGNSNNAAHFKTSGVLETWGTFSGNNALGLGAKLPNNVVQTTQNCDTSSSTCWGPVPVLATQPYIALTASATVMVAIRADGTLWAWGGTMAVPTQIGTATWLEVSNQYNDAGVLAVKADGTLWTWNGNFSAAPTQLCTTGACAGHTWTAVASGGEASLAVSTDGTLWGWGSPSSGDLLNDLATETKPVNLIPYGPAGWPTTWLDVQSSNQAVSAVDTNGALWGWGYDPYGDVGDGNQNPGNDPIRTPSRVLDNVVSVWRCADSAIAMDVQSNFYIWGENQGGELGTGWSSGSSEAPVYWVTNALTGFQPGHDATDPSVGNFQWPGALSPAPLAIACGAGSTFVEDNQTGVWAAGDNSLGELGLGFSGGGNFLFQQQAQQALYPDNVNPVASSASLNNGNAGNVNTGGSWSTSPTKQASGQWFQMDLGASKYLSGVALGASSSTTFPAAYSVSVSIDNVHFTNVASTAGTGQYMSIMFPVQWAQYVRITLTGSSTNTWSISTIEGLY